MLMALDFEAVNLLKRARCKQERTADASTAQIDHGYTHPQDQNNNENNNREMMVTSLSAQLSGILCDPFALMPT